MAYFLGDNGGDVLLSFRPLMSPSWHMHTFTIIINIRSVYNVLIILFCFLNVLNYRKATSRENVQLLYLSSRENVQLLGGAIYHLYYTDVLYRIV